MSTKFITKFSVFYTNETIYNFSKGFTEQELDEFSDAHTEEHIFDLMLLFPPPFLYEIYSVYKRKLD